MGRYAWLARFSAPGTLKSSKTVIPMTFEGKAYLLALVLMKAVDRRSLRRPAGSIAVYRDDILRGLDWLFTGL